MKSRTRESREEKQVSEKLAVVDPLSSTFSSNGVECINIFGKDGDLRRALFADVYLTL